MPAPQGMDFPLSNAQAANSRKIEMNKRLTLTTALLAATLLALSAAHAQTMSKADYQASKARISAGYKSDKAACMSLAGNAKDICGVEAKAQEKVARADLEYGYSGTAADADKVSVAKAESTYAVAKERCDDLAGNPKDVCVKEAQAAKVRALADVKTGREVGQARRDGAADKRDADYKVAIQKCDALADEAKVGCVASAKASFGKT